MDVYRRAQAGKDGDTEIPGSNANKPEYSVSYRDNVNAGIATVIVTDNNGGNYTVNGTATFEIGTAPAAVGMAPTGKSGLKYNGTAQELLDTLGTATGGTLVYSLSETGEYSAAIPTGKAVGEYEIWYKVLGDSNHSDSSAAALSPKVKIDKNTVANPTIQVTPESVKYTGEKQEPTITVKDDNGLLIDGSEYTATYADTANSNNSDLTQVGTYTVTITGVANGNYTFDATDGKNTATFTITQADQTPLTITGTRERVYYGDTIPLGTIGGSSGGTVTWKVSDSNIADITNGLLTIKGVGPVTVTATSTKTGYANQTATWALYAEKKPVTAVVTATAKDYDGGKAATVTATLQTSDFVGTDSFTITLTGCTFEDANAGTDKKVNVVSTNPTFMPDTGNHENYAITYPATATASIFKADLADSDVNAPTAATGLTYTGLPLTLVTAGTATGGAMEYSTDGVNYSASLPTGTDAGDYNVWYRVKGDGNHKDTEGTKLDNPVNIAPQEVAAPIIEFTPDSASYDGAVHKPTVTVKDANHRVIPGSEYTVTYSNTDWKTASSAAVKHTVTITDKSGGNYEITAKTAKFTISIMGQNPLSIVGQPGAIRYGDSFTLSTTGGSGTGTVTWVSSDTAVATIGQNGLVKVLKSGAATITATKQADGNYGAVSVNWSFSAEKKPVTAIVTAKDKEYDQNDNADLVITWKDGDVLSGDTIDLTNVLTGKFHNANAGDNKQVTIQLNAGAVLPLSDKYDIKIPASTTASITPKAATLEAVQNQSRNIVIKPEITGDVSKTQVSIPASTVSQINSQTDAALTVASPIADVTIPNGALDTLGSAGGTVNVVTEQVGDAVALTLTAGGETVDSVPGGVTLTVPAEDAGAGTVAVLIHDDGTREVLQRSVVKDGKLSATLSGSATVEIVDNGKTFADVRPTDWAAEAVTFASARELFNGTSETTFSPDATTSRGMVATVLYRLEGQPEQALADVYHDVSDDAWYADSVAWAAENGIVNGYGDGQFGPNDSVTREQFVVMLWRYVGSPKANNHDLTAFNDADQINGYALEALCWAVENGVLNGNGNGRLAPEGTATRAEAAQILKNFIENI